MSWITVLSAIPALVQVISELVRQFEVPGNGAQKKAAVLEVLKTSLDTLSRMGITVPGTIVLTLASAIIDAVVAGYNALGLFKKAGAGAGDGGSI